MTLQLGRTGMRDIMKLHFLEYKTQKPFLYSPYANSTENDWKADEVFATGGSGGAKRLSFNSNKEGTIKISTQIFTMKHLAMLQGTDVSTALKNIYKQEILTVKEDTSTTPSTLYIEIGRAIVDWNGDGVVDENDVAILKYINGVQGDEVGTAALTTTTTGGITTTRVDIIDTVGVAKGDEVQVWYQYAPTKSYSVTVYADQFPKFFTIVGDTFVKDENGDTVKAQLVYYKCKPKANFNLKMANSGDPTSLEIEVDLFSHEIAGVDVMADIIEYED